MPLAAAPGFDHFGGDNVHEDLGERASFRIPFEVIGGLIPREGRVNHHRQEQDVAVVDDDELAAGAFLRGVVDQVLFSAVGADIAFERELARHNLFDRDLLVPAVATVLLVPAAGLRDVFRVAERATYLRDGFPGHPSILLPTALATGNWQLATANCEPRTYLAAPARSRIAGAYMLS